MKRPVFALSCMTALALAAPRARAQDPDPRDLFRQQQYAAAAAGFEKRWNAAGDPTEGINAVVAWRVSAKYAHARGLLDRIRRSNVAFSPDLSSRADVLADKLARLTATIELQGEEIPPGLAGIVVRVDGVPAEHAGDAIVADVGHTDVSIEKEGCPPFRWTGDLFPAETRRLVVQFDCPTSPGNVHVALKTIPDAKVSIDETTSDVHYDLDVRIPAGTHHVKVERYGFALLSEDVPVKPRETSLRELPVPLHAQKGPFMVGAATGAYAGSLGATGVAAASLGMGQENTVYVRLMLGGSFSSAERETSSIWFGVVASGQLLRPLLTGSRPGSIWTLDVQPLAAHLGMSTRGDFSTDNEQLYSVGLVPVRLAWSTADVMVDFTVLPLGGTLHVSQTSFKAPSTTDLGYTATALLGVSYGFLGN